MASDKITATQLALPVFLLTVAVTGFLAFQTTLLVSDRSGLHQAYTQQDKPLEQIAKIKAQLNALAIGTLKLSQQGNKDAEIIITQMKKAGIDVSDQAPAEAPATGITPKTDGAPKAEGAAKP